MKKKENSINSLAKRILIALVLGIIAGIGIIFIRESLNTSNPELWATINRLLFADITAEGNESALGLFYLIGQLFVRALQLIIIPMVFTSIVLAMIAISDAARFGRISRKTLFNFLATTVISLLLAGVTGMACYAVPSNITSAFTNNGGVLAIVFVAVCVGLAINANREKIDVLPKLCREVNDIITVFLTYVVNTFAPIAIFCLITRTFASYGISLLAPAAIYMVITTILLLLTLILGYGLYVWIRTGLNPVPFVKKIAKVAMFGFSTSSSAATLPLNLQVTTDELGVEKEISSFVLPLGMTINMDGTAIMQVIAAIFIASCGGYDITIVSVLTIAVLALVASVGTPAAPGAGAVVLFTILSGMGYANEPALMAYTLILAINRPIEMLVTALNVVGDSACSLIVAKSEGQLNEETYNRLDQ